MTILGISGTIYFYQKQLECSTVTNCINGNINNEENKNTENLEELNNNSKITELREYVMQENEEKNDVLEQIMEVEKKIYVKKMK